MTYDEIMNRIQSGLTGERSHDIRWLYEQMDQYKDEKEGKAIIRECGRMIWQLLPEEDRQKMEDARQKDADEMNARLKEIEDLMMQKKFPEAEARLKPMAEDLLSAPLMKEDSQSQYYDFSEPFQVLLFDYLYHPDKEIRGAFLPYTRIFTLYGCLLVDLGKLSEARSMLENALKWNPIDAKAHFELIETYKMEGDFETFFERTLKTFPFLYRRDELARAYRNLGFYFSEKKQFEDALCCLTLSLLFDEKSPMAANEIDYIAAVTNKQPQVPSAQEISRCADRYHFPFGADEDVVYLAETAGEACYKSGDLGLALNYLQIAWQLTEDEDIHKLMESIQKTLQEQESAAPGSRTKH